MAKSGISDAQVSHVICEVIVDKLGNVERREHRQVLKADPLNPIPISRKAYTAAVGRGIPYKVNAYEPDGNYNEGEEEEKPTGYHTSWM